MRQLDDMCLQIKDLADQLTQVGVGKHEDQVVSDVVTTIQRIGEGIAWAYGQHQHSGLGEQFAQPFVDCRMRERFHELLTERGKMTRVSQNRVAAQILQTIHILLQATPAESTLFCSLTSGWYLNRVVAAHFDFCETEDLLPLWMTVVKDIATMLTKDNMMLFFDPMSTKPFPIFSEAIKYYHHPVSQVRTHVQATSLEIFLKLRDEDVWTEPLFKVVVEDSCMYFTHVCVLLRDFWMMADEAMRTGARRDARSALYIQNDILMYLNDIFVCEIPQLSEILQEKLLRFALLPVLVRSLLRPQHGPNPRDVLAPTLASYLLFDVLTTMRSTSIFGAVAAVLLSPTLPEEIQKLVLAPPARTPTQYVSLQSMWSSEARTGAFESSDLSVPDEELYAIPPAPLVSRLADANQSTSRNNLLDTLESMFRGFVDEGLSLPYAAYTEGQVMIVSSEPQTRSPAMMVSMIGVIILLLRTLGNAGQVAAGRFVVWLSASLGGLLAKPQRFKWLVLESALFLLRELLSLGEPGREPLAQPLRETLLCFLASEMARELKTLRGPARELWQLEFQEQWAAHEGQLSEPAINELQCELLDHKPAVPETYSRTKTLYVMLHARKLLLNDGIKHPMPGIGDAEKEESSMFQPGLSVHIGKMNRVKCHVRHGRKAGAQEPLYLLPAKAMVVLVRPDEEKPFWAVPVIVEPLRHVRVILGAEPSPLAEPLPALGHVGEATRSFRLEVLRPQSPFLSGSQRGAAVTEKQFRSIPTLKGDSEADLAVPLTLLFADERRKRVACQIVVQSRHSVFQHMAEQTGAFVTGLRERR